MGQVLTGRVLVENAVYAVANVRMSQVRWQAVPQTRSGCSKPVSVAVSQSEKPIVAKLLLDKVRNKKRT